MTIPSFPSLSGIEWPLKRKVIWKTLKQESLSGKTTNIPLWTFPRYQWSASFSTLRYAVGLAEYQSLMGFINALSGAAQPFYYTDTNDNTVSGQSFGLGDGATTSFQLVRALGGYAEPMQSIVGTPVITVSGTPTTAFTVSNVGVVTFTTAPAVSAALLWSGSFRWLCRLDSDEAEFSEFVSSIYSMDKLQFTSEKL